jgi:multidrug efflux pump subunit AcrA (membrane-fusion protein)
MIRYLFVAGATVVLLAIPSVAQEPSAVPGDPVIHDARVRIADQIKLPAKEAGVLVHVAVKEGTQVRAGQELAKIDDSEAQMQKAAANAAYVAAYKRWEDDIEIRYQVVAAAAAKADYEQLVEANSIADRAIPASELRFKKLEWDKTLLGAEKAKHERLIAGYEAKTKKVELDAADLAIKRRLITSPFDGVVEELKRKQDEWVAPGDAILTLLRLDTVYVDGAVEQTQYDPHEIQGCKVTVVVTMARGREATVQGQITKVSSIVRSDGVYNVRAEVPNLQEHGTWVLRDGLPATMTIHLGTGGTAAAAK